MLQIGGLYSPQTATILRAHLTNMRMVGREAPLWDYELRAALESAAALREPITLELSPSSAFEPSTLISEARRTHELVIRYDHDQLGIFFDGWHRLNFGRRGTTIVGHIDAKDAADGVRVGEAMRLIRLLDEPLFPLWLVDGPRSDLQARRALDRWAGRIV